MISIWVVVLFVAFVEITHLIGDWFLQTSEQAMNKWQSNKHLAEHIASLFIVQAGVVWGLLMVGLITPSIFTLGILWVVLNSLIHFIIDRNTAKATRHYKQIGREDMFWNMIGFDQFLHRLFYYGTGLLLWSVL